MADNSTDYEQWLFDGRSPQDYTFEGVSPEGWTYDGVSPQGFSLTKGVPDGYADPKVSEFSKWYGDWAEKSGMNPNPDDPNHFYDYRAAYNAGVTPPEPGGHWPSEFKTEGHPRMVVDGVNTKTGLPSIAEEDTSSGLPSGMGAMMDSPDGVPMPKTIFGVPAGKLLSSISRGMGAIANAMDPQGKPGQAALNMYAENENKRVMDERTGLEKKKMGMLSEQNQVKLQKMLKEDTDKKAQAEYTAKLIGSKPGTPEFISYLQGLASAGGDVSKYLSYLIPKESTVTELGKQLRERQQHPEGSFERQAYDNKINVVQADSGAGKRAEFELLYPEWKGKVGTPEYAAAFKEKSKAAKEERDTNMQPSYDLVGTEVLGSAYRTSEGKQKFADLYASNPKIRQAVTAKQNEEAKAKFQGFSPQVVYLQTNEGIVPMPVRGPGVGSIQTGKPVEGIGKALPSEQMSRLADLDTLTKQIGDTKRMFKPEYVGPVGGRVGAIKEKFVDLPEEQVKFYATVKDMKDALLRARSGAQINEQEYKRLKAFLPDENLPSGNFKARLDRFETAVGQVYSSKISELAAGGYGSRSGSKKAESMGSSSPKRDPLGIR